MEEEQVTAVRQAVEGLGRLGMLDLGAVVPKAHGLGGAPTVAVVIGNRVPDVAGHCPHGGEQSPVRQKHQTRLLGKTVAAGVLGFDVGRDSNGPGLVRQPGDFQVPGVGALIHVLEAHELDAAVAVVAIPPDGPGIGHGAAPSGEAHDHAILGIPNGLLPDHARGVDLGIGVVETGPPPRDIHPARDPGTAIVIGILHPQGRGIESPVPVSQVPVVQAVHPPRTADQGKPQRRNHVLVPGLVNGNDRGPGLPAIPASRAHHSQVGGTLMGSLGPHAHEIPPGRVKDVNVVGVLVALPGSLLQIDGIVGGGPFPIVGVAVPVGHRRFFSLRCRRFPAWRRPGPMAVNQPPNLFDVSGQLKEKSTPRRPGSPGPEGRTPMQPLCRCGSRQESRDSRLPF